MKHIIDIFFYKRPIVLYKKLFYVLFLTLFSQFFLSSSASAITSSIDITIPTSIVMNVIPTDPNGTVVISDQTTSSIMIKTNNATGYTLGIQSDSSISPALTSTNGSIPSISSAISSVSDFTNGTWGYKPTKKNGTSWDNLTVDSNPSGYFLPAPTSSRSTIDITNTANTTDNEYNLAIATKIGNETSIGSYSKTFTIIAIANPVPYSITYNANAGTDTVTNLPSTQSSSTVDSVVSLSNTTPTRTGYNFIGWCTNNASQTNCSGTTYQPGSSYPIDQTGNNTINLYAVWEVKTLTITITAGVGGSFSSTSHVSSHTSYVQYGKYYHIMTVMSGDGSDPRYDLLFSNSPSGITGSRVGIYPDAGYTIDRVDGSSCGSFEGNEGGPLTQNCVIAISFKIQTITFDQAFVNAGKTKLDGYHYRMQDMTPEICNAVTGPTTTSEDISVQLVDARDNKVYWVSKLLDGNCWMTQNLDYDLSVSANKKLNNTTSDVISNVTLSVSNASYGGTSDTALYYKDGGDITYANGNSTSGTSTSNLMSNDPQWHYHAGSYYSWRAATANTYTPTEPQFPPTIVNASGSICPKGWRLPIAKTESKNDISEFLNLNNLYNGNTNSDAVMLASPLFFTRGGSVNGNASVLLLFVGANGYYWSSSVDSSGPTAAYNFSIASTYVGDDFYMRFIGMSIRCVAR